MTRLLLAFAICLCTLELFSQVLINEICASNLNGLTDGDGDHEDWVELYNAGSSAVNLSGWFLSDDPATPQKWVIPNGQTIAAGAYRTVICSGKDKIAGTYMHTNFKITQTKSESLLLSQPNGTAVDIYNFVIPNQVNHSYGRSPNGGPSWKIYTTPTPGAANTGTYYQNYAPDVIASMNAGFYSGSVSVSLSTAAGYTIRYTTSGNEPTATSPIYSGNLNFSATTVLKARAYSSNPQILAGFVTANTYFVNVNHTVPVVSIAGNNITNLLNGTQTNPIGSFEYFENNMLETEAYGEFNKHGNDSWAYPQRGIDWVTRDQLGYKDELKHEFFPERDRKKFQRLILKAGANDNYPSSNGAHIRDSYVHTLALHGGLNLDVRTHRSIVLYVNGNYWGVYDLREKVDDSDYTKHYYDQDEFDIDYIKTWGSTWEEYGSFTDWYTLKNFILNNNMATPANYAYVEQQFDLLSLIDYVIINQHSVCKDWLNWNTSWWRGNNPNGGAKRWRYALWDMDATFGHYINYTGIPNTGPTADPCDVELISNSGDPQNHIDIFMALYNNPAFKALYVNRYADLLNTSLSCENMIALLDSMVNTIAPEMQQHCTKWGGTVSQWNQNVNTLRNFINTRCQVLEPSIVDCYEVTGPFQLTVNVSPAGSPNQVQVNTVTPATYPYVGNYFGGISIDLAALPAPGWQFDHWEVSGNSFGPNQLAGAIDLAFQSTGVVTAFFVLSGPCIPPDGVAISSTTLTPVMDWTDQPVASSYLIQYRKVGDPAWTVVTTPGTTWNFDTLPGCTQYEGQIQSVCPLGSSPFVDFAFATPDLLPGFELADAVICNKGSALLDATVPGASYLWDDGSGAPTLPVASPGNYSVTVQLNGCSATDQAQVSQVQATATLQPILCPGENFVVGSETFDEQQPSGQVIFPNMGANGCDSIVQVSLQFLAASQNLISLTSCDPSAVGADTLVLNNAVGCDSLVITTTTFAAESQTNLAAFSCNPGSVGTDTVFLVNAFGCDSLVITTTTFDASGISVTPLFAQSCNPASIGVDTVFLTNVTGCDSLVITTTSFDASAIPVTALSALSCNPASVGVDTVILTNAGGCDSLVITTTTQAPFSQTALSALSCNPSSVGVDTVILANSFGCDSLVITTTTLAPYSQTLLSAISCNPTSLGIDTVLLTNVFGCDSLVITTTTFDPGGISITQLSALNCNPASAGVDTVLLTNAAGCDSLVITTTSLAPYSQTNLTAFSCNPATIGVDTVLLNNVTGCDSLVITTTSFDPGGISITQLSAFNCNQASVGVDTVLLTNAGGCDSLVITTTTLAPYSQTNLTALSCNPASVGVDTVLLSNAFGCDSLVVTATSLAPISQTFLTALSCNPNAVGTDTLLLSNQYGCDSLVITATSFDPGGISLTPVFLQSCNPASVGVDTVLLTNAAGCDSLVVTSTSLVPFSQTFLTALTCNVASVGMDTVLLSNQYGCDSLVITAVSFAGVDFEVSAQDPLCFGGTDGLITLSTVSTTFLPVEFVLENHPAQAYSGTSLQWADLPAGVYSLTATNSPGCTATQTVEVAEANELLLNLEQDQLDLHLGDSIWVAPATSNFQIMSAEWSPPGGVHCLDCPGTYISAPATTIYTLTAADANGCSTSASLTVEVDDKVRIFVPNALRPGSGGLNEDLIIFAGPEVERIRSLQLFDRWGNQLFQQQNFAPNVPTAWDGRFRGQLIPTGVIVWMLTAETRDGRVVNLSGDMTVLR